MFVCELNMMMLFYIIWQNIQFDIKKNYEDIQLNEPILHFWYKQQPKIQVKSSMTWE
jgi:protoheme ferro-lyase